MISTQGIDTGNQTNYLKKTRKLVLKQVMTAYFKDGVIAEDGSKLNQGGWTLLDQKLSTRCKGAVKQHVDANRTWMCEVCNIYCVYTVYIVYIF